MTTTHIVHNTCAHDKPHKPKKNSGKRHPGGTKRNNGADTKYVGSHSLDHFKSKSKTPRPLPFSATYQPSSAPPYVNAVVKVVDSLKGPMTAAKMSTAMTLMANGTKALDNIPPEPP